MFHGFFGYLVGGTIVGVLARILKPGPENVGMVMTIVIGALAAAVAGALVHGRGFIAWVVAVVAAIVMLAIYQRVFHRRRVRRR